MPTNGAKGLMNEPAIEAHMSVNSAAPILDAAVPSPYVGRDREGVDEQTGDERTRVREQCGAQLGRSGSLPYVGRDREGGR